MITNRVFVTNSLTLLSLNGPGVTTIVGNRVPGQYVDGGVRCVYLADGAVLSGFTVTNGEAMGLYGGGNFDHQGGGIYCQSGSSVVSNCVIAGNVAFYVGGGVYGGTLNNCTVSGNSATNGGGAYGGTLNNCTISGNFTVPGGYGGGAFSCTLNNCTISHNTNSAVAHSTLNNCTVINNDYGCVFATLNNCTVSGNTANYDGAGVYYCTLNNSIVYYNAAGNFNSCTFNYCCTTPLPGGPGNFTNAPLFVNQAVGDFHLQPGSPCINSGLNTYAPGTNDLDGNARIRGGTVDVGAYEVQNPASILSYAWLQGFGLPVNGSADFADADGDGMNNWQEWMAGTDPTNSASVLRMLTASNGVLGVAVTWQSVNNRTYFLERSGNLALRPAFHSVISNLVGQAGKTLYKDTNAIGTDPFFYRVGVQ
jgi:hypothetical protein